MPNEVSAIESKQEIFKGEVVRNEAMKFIRMGSRVELNRAKQVVSLGTVCSDSTVKDMRKAFAGEVEGEKVNSDLMK